MKKMENTKIGSHKTPAKQLAVIAIMAGLGIIAATIIKFPLIPGVEFLTYDPDDIPVLLVTIIYGPLSGIAAAFLVSLFESFHATTGFWGILMHLVASSSLALVVGLVLKIKKDWIIFALFVGAASTVVVMVILNLLITPIYLEIPLEAVKKLIVPAIIPFNVIKGLLNTTLTYLIYRGLKGKTDLL